MQISQITHEIELFAPCVYSENYDNVGLLVGNANEECTGVLLSLDCTEEVIDEAIASKCNLIVSHHPLIFSGLKKITGKNLVERCVIKAIKNNIALYACHTNIDNVIAGVNAKIAQKLQLTNHRILSPAEHLLKKVVTFVPKSHHQQVLEALFVAGAGHIGKYSHCSFYHEGTGTYQGNQFTKPFIGKAGELSKEVEVRLETVFPAYKQQQIIKTLLQTHPYEEVAYDIYSIENQYNNVGSGLIAELNTPCTEIDFLQRVKSNFDLNTLKHSPFRGNTVKKIAICGGSGKFLMKDAMNAGADVFLTADLKYHDFFEADGKILLIDIGHYESEQFTPEIFYSIITNKFPTFAIHLSKINTNPVNYF